MAKITATENQLAKNMEQGQQILSSALQKSSQQNSALNNKVRTKVKSSNNERTSNAREVGQDAKAFSEQAQAVISRSIKKTTSSILNIRQAAVNDQA